jgi:hypothetical protein
MNKIGIILLYAFFWVIPRRLNANVSEHAVCFIFIGRYVLYPLYLSAYEDGTVCFETSTYKI